MYNFNDSYLFQVMMSYEIPPVFIVIFIVVIGFCLVYADWTIWHVLLVGWLSSYKFPSLFDVLKPIKIWIHAKFRSRFCTLENITLFYGWIFTWMHRALGKESRYLELSITVWASFVLLVQWLFFIVNLNTSGINKHSKLEGTTLRHFCLTWSKRIHF